MDVTYLSQTSWIATCKLPKELYPNFNDLWQTHPLEKGKVKIYGKEIETPRWHASYLNDYTFSGITLNNKNTIIPPAVSKIFEWANTNETEKYNQILVNWYENGHHYIGKHSDDEKQLIPESYIFSLSLGSTRTFRIRNKESKKIVRDITLNDGDIVIMGGTTQKEFTHEITKISGKKGESISRRINITFRKFNSK